ncbi:MAG: hypothetical protein ACKV0T_01470 [Planctomycetales bacterium]
MSATNRTPSEPRRFRFSLPHPLWLFLVTVRLVGAVFGLWLGLPINGQQASTTA